MSDESSQTVPTTHAATRIANSISEELAFDLKSTIKNALNVSLLQCQVCDDSRAEQYCYSCNGAMCADCATAHKDTTLFKGHVVVPYTVDALKPFTCHKHKGRSLITYCEECLTFLCSTCKVNHITHALLPTNNASEFCQIAYHQLIQKLTNAALHCDKYKDKIQDIKAYTEAAEEIKKHKAELLKYITAREQEMLRKLMQTKKQFEKILQNEECGLSSVVHDIDILVNKLACLWKVDDRDVCTKELIKSGMYLPLVEDFGKRLTSMAEPTVCEILKYTQPTESSFFRDKTHMETAKAAIDVVFEMTSPSELLAFGPDPNKIKQVSSFDLKMEDEKWVSYRFCQSNGNGNIIVYRGDDVYVLDPITLALEEHKADMQISNAVHTDENQFVASSGGGKSIHILNGTFKTISTTAADGEVAALAYHSPRHFVVYYDKPYSDNITKLALMKITADGASIETERKLSLDIRQCFSRMGVYSNNSQVSLCGGSWEVYTINLDTEKFVSTKVDYPSCGQFGFHVDGAGTLWMVDTKSNVHLYDMHHEHRVVEEASNESNDIRDIIVHSGRLFAVSRQCKLVVFS